MTKDFDLTSPNWLDMIFEKRNKQYGAYALRADSSSRHLKSLIIVAILGLTAIFLPRIIVSMVPKDDAVSVTTVVDMTNFAKNDVPDDPEEIVQPVEPPPALRAQVIYTEAIIVDDSKIQETALIQANEELNKLDDIDIGTKNEEGAGTVRRSEETMASVAPVDDVKTIYRFVQQRPSFPGGSEALSRWLGDNIRYPSAAQDAGQQGQVQVEFIVRSNGKVDGIKVVKPSDHASLNREAERLINQMAKEKTWIAGRQNGTAVDVYFICPINFVLK
jgi:protein TonB